MKKLLIAVFLIVTHIALAQPNGFPITNKPTGGSMGSAATTVDVASLFNINQTTAGQTITVPALTGTAKSIQINNIGSATFTLSPGGDLPPGYGAYLRWTGSAWNVTGMGYATSGGGVALTQTVTNGDQANATSGDAVYDFVQTVASAKLDASAFTDANITTSDIATNNASTLKHGFLRKLSGSATQYMDGSGNWSTPAGAGGADSSVYATQNDLSVGLALKVDKSGSKVLSDENYSTAEKSKLAGIAAGATVNSSDATLLARANHTGTQAYTTITGLGGAAILNVGTSSGTIAAGDDSRFSAINTNTQNALDLKAPLASPSLTGTPIAPTATSGTNTTQVATTAFVNNAIQDGSKLYAVTTNSGNVYSATLTPAITAYTAGQSFKISFNATNTGAVTINFNSLGAKSVVKGGSLALQSNDLVVGTIYTLTYDGTKFQADIGLIGYCYDFIPTVTGYSVSPTVDYARYSLNGKLLYISVSMTSSGTSNNTAHYISLPVGLAYGIQRFTILTIDGSVLATGYGQTANGSTQVFMAKTPASVNWTSGAINVFMFNVVLEIQ